MNHLFVANPSARTGKARERIQEVIARMVARRMDVELLETQPEGRTPELVRQRLDAGDFDVVLGMGGDGTFSEVARGLIKARRRIPMAFIPAGTANDQGLSFGIPREDVDFVLGVIQAGHVKRIDVGRVARIGDDGKATHIENFFHSVGWGMQPEILHQRNQDRDVVGRIPLLREIYRDKAVYVGATLNRLAASWVEPPQFSADVRVDGVRGRLDDLTDLIVNATPVYGGAWVYDRAAEPDDGAFEVVPIRGRMEMASKAILDLAQNPLRAEHLAPLGVSHSEVFRCTELDVELRRGSSVKELSTQVDGDEWIGGTRFKLTVLKQALPLMVPRDWTPPWR